jgi:hypothetical protein
MEATQTANPPIKKTWKRSGGRKLKYGEKTMMVGVVIPISKEKNFWETVNELKRQWLSEAKKTA